MRVTINLFLLGATCLLYAQRVNFQDPELKFSLKKPASWEVFDNGYVVKVSPTAKDSSTIYFSITYFTPPQPIEGLTAEDLLSLIPESSVADQFDDFPQSKTTIKLFKKKIKWRTSNNGKLTFRFYQISHLGQNWEIVSAAPIENFLSYEQTFAKMIQSVKAKRKTKQ